jgi:hypothetical protein
MQKAFILFLFIAHSVSYAAEEADPFIEIESLQCSPTIVGRESTAAEKEPNLVVKKQENGKYSIIVKGNLVAEDYSCIFARKQPRIFSCNLYKDPAVRSSLIAWASSHVRIVTDSGIWDRPHVQNLPDIKGDSIFSGPIDEGFVDVTVSVPNTSPAKAFNGLYYFPSSCIVN